ncbi:MAG TPA: FTR1 family protein [Nitrososphaeraceae archaeon]|nr:FTR1 family protein [Nitrososphaeraceae archaeon]
MTNKRATNLDTIKVAPSISHDTVIMSSIVIVHLLIFSLFSTNYLVNAQNDNNNLISTNSILTRASNNNTRLNATDAFIVLFNIQRIQTQLDLSRDALNKGDSYAAFAHAYIPHSVIYPYIRNLVEQVSENGSTSTTKKLESALTDIPFMIKSGSSFNGVRDAIAKDKSLLNSISSNIAESIPNTYRIPVMLQTAVFLLRDAEKSYQLSNASTSSGSYSNNVGQNNKDTSKQRQLSQIDYENAIGLVNTSKSIYGQIFASVGNSNNSNKNSEIELSLNQLDYLLRNRSNDQIVSKLVNSIEHTVGQSLLNSPSSNPANNSLSGPPNNQYIQYFANIRNLLQSLIVDVKKDDYMSAEQAAVNAYLDNFEYLEPPIEKHDFKLKSDIELAMREQLRQMIKDKMPSDKIISFVNSVLLNLDKAQSLLNSNPSLYRGSATSGNSGITTSTLLNMKSSLGVIKNGETFADIQTLSKGFGIYTGERKSIGQTSDASKVSVRNNIDQIRLSLEDMLKQYSKGSYGDALSTSRSAYLDSYENIEVPLRPINPDFTLDMEIKFAELRNLIQAKASFENVQEKTFEIRQGLDESERLVSGTGVIAPSIAFSTSFSIIFREGLESALIVGAILTYLEASRNEQFKKHVYYGIAIAVLATAVTWFIAQYIIEISGINRELIEAIAGISAVVVLFWVSFWVLNKVETKKWIEFVKAKVWKATTTGSVMVFVMLSFFTIYREGFETVLFYQAMLSFAKYMEMYVIAGLTLGIAIIVGLVFLIRRLGKKLPLRVLFGLTMGIGAYMSIAFMGNTIRSFQEAGYIPITDMIGMVPRLDINMANMTGIHPTLETIIAQIVLLSVYLVGSLYILILQPKRKKAIEISRKSMSDLEKSRKREGQ